MPSFEQDSVKLLPKIALGSHSTQIFPKTCQLFRSLGNLSTFVALSWRVKVTSYRQWACIMKLTSSDAPTKKYKTRLKHVAAPVNCFPSAKKIRLIGQDVGSGSACLLVPIDFKNILHWCSTIWRSCYVGAWPYCGANRTFEFLSLALFFH